ncbi:molybdopterin-dependent oxidoreductase [Rhizobium sp. SL42]|uniref:molybdopterin-dependent oxidoreductase n=1 Tax=Rhizobium sp. SL42 TaxID=2806346 RepID=UPI001F2EBFAC|nr:molybdopterin-dependent oxidoreductase [Rhizobium sp. SL42]UJW73801.1 molybdopterin-dependent oxidoreductase [Rhizobium sp. SL42]
MTEAPDISHNNKKCSEPSTDQRHVAAHWGFYSHDTQADALKPHPADPDPAQFGTELLADRLAPCRIVRPAVRRSYLENGPGPGSGTSRRGAEPFVEVSWQEALDLVAAEIRRVRDTYGPEAIFSGSYGWSSAGRFHHAQSQLKRFFNTVGGSYRSVQTYSYAAGEVILPHVIGTTDGMISGHTPWSQIVGHSELIVMFGGTPLRNAQVNAGGVSRHETRDGLRACRAAGANFVNIGPVKDDVATELDAEWLALRPGTDAALILALAHTLIVEDLYDADFVVRYTAGFDQFRDYLLGNGSGTSDGIAKNAAWASAITGLNAEVITDLARAMAAQRTLIMMSWSLQRADHGEQPYWATVALASLLGTIGLPGGGFGFGYASVAGIGQSAPATRWPALPQGRNAVSGVIPVARIADMLLSPGGSYEYNGRTCTYPDIKLVYWAGGNPFHHHQDLNRLTQAWQRPDTIIAHEHWWNAHAKHADIVLPAATYLERDDIAASGRDSFIGYSSGLFPAPQDVLTDHHILRELAKRFGTDQAFTEGLDEDQWLRRLYTETRTGAAQIGIEMPDFDEFRDIGLIEIAGKRADLPFLAAFRADPSANPLNTPSGRIEIGSSVIESFGYDDCPGHPAWIEPREWLGAEAASIFPLHLLSCQPHDKLHSQWDHAKPSRRTKRERHQPVRLHPQDAAARSIVDGDTVKITSPRGECLAIASITDAVRPGVVQMSTGAWFDPSDPACPGSLEINGNPNVLTPDHGTSRLAQGPSPNSCLVEITGFAGVIPVSHAYRPPDFVADPRLERKTDKER